MRRFLVSHKLSTDRTALSLTTKRPCLSRNWKLWAQNWSKTLRSNWVGGPDLSNLSGLPISPKSQRWS